MPIFALMRYHMPMDCYERICSTIQQHKLATPQTPVLLMVSGGSDSTALAYVGARLHDEKLIGPVAILHVNHQLRGEEADADAHFVQLLADALSIPCFQCQIDIPMLAAQGGNVEAIARTERYTAANEALESLCRHAKEPLSEGRIFTAHTQDDRVENFYMRSIVGTGPGGFRAMRYRNGNVARPCLDVSRQDLRDYLALQQQKAAAGDADAQGHAEVCVLDPQTDGLWREDATNAHTDKFRAYVRHEIVPKAKERNPQILDVLCRTMNNIADEDDMLDAQAQDIIDECAEWLCVLDEVGTVDYAAGCVLAPEFGRYPLPLQRRAAFKVLQQILSTGTRVQSSSVEAALAAFENESPVSGYTNNIQGDLALSANKSGLRIEPMAAYRTRRKSR